MRSRSKGIAPERSNAYSQVFLKHVHLLIWHGYSQLNRSILATLHEPAISGLICQGIEQHLDNPQAPRWVTDYDVYDDPPVHDKVRKGKNRRRVDIKLASRRTRPRTRFCFEAKCLNKKAGVAAYLGKDGLGQFISGSYAAEASQAGMLVYVQTDDCNVWCGKIEKSLDQRKHKLGRAGQWQLRHVIPSLPFTYQTAHTRPGKLPNIVVLHTLLDCT